MAKPQISTNQKVRDLIAKGMSTQQIVKTLNISPQVVYNTRHRLNRNRGIGALPVTGITIDQIKAVSAQLQAKHKAKKSLWQRFVSMFAWH